MAPYLRVEPLAYSQIDRVFRGDGTVEYIDDNGDWHRADDLPAIEFPEGDREWWVHGRRHRDDDQPAVVSARRGREWWVNGVLHRDGDRPAVVRPAGGREWWLDGLWHRVIGPASIPTVGPQQWSLRGERAQPDQESRLQRVYSWTEQDTVLPSVLLDVMGNDPWVAAVALSRPELCAVLPPQVHTFVLLLASQMAGQKP